MKKSNIKLTTAQFAKLHNVNKRTLHYYDNIGLFSPNTKGENGYRYYDLSQSIEFEYILMLRELNVSIDDIEEYIKRPTEENFIRLATAKEVEINNQIKRLKLIKKTIHEKKNQIELCQSLEISKFEINECKEEKLLILPYDFDDDISNTFSFMAKSWSVEQIRMGVGGMISINKVLKNDFSKYDGIYTPALYPNPAKNIFHKPKGTYITYYHRGEWDTLPHAYHQLIKYSKKNDLEMTGYAYEMGMNEFALSNEEDYVTKISIRIENTRHSIFDR